MSQPLRISAFLTGAICLPEHSIALDALLAYQVALRDNLPPAMAEEEVLPIEIPVEREPGGRFHLATVATHDPIERELRYTNRRFPIEQAQMIGEERLRQVRTNAGPGKSYRIPRETVHLRGGALTWWCIGDAGGIEELLRPVSHLGKRRAVGIGKVSLWSIERCEPWGDGFPIVAPDGSPLRNLPLDWPGVREGAPRAYANLTYPYWLTSRDRECFAPTAGARMAEESQP